MKRQIAGIVLICLAAAAGAADMRPADEMTFDKYKGKIYATYTREMKDHPKLVGRVVMEIRIATEGRVANCRILSSNLPAPDLADKLCERVREFQFKPRPAATTFTKELSFFPAG